MRLAPIVPVSAQRVAIGEGLGGMLDTVALMRRLAREGSRDMSVRTAATQVVYLQPERNELHEVNSLFEYVRDHVRYVRDPLFFEAVAVPAQVLALGFGDCDDKATLLAAMLESVGYLSRFVVAGYNDAERPEHVYLQVFVGGQWIDADPTEHKPLGYAPPDPVFFWIERV
jgi:transglutaminase-like putative cysteine protease